MGLSGFVALRSGRFLQLVAGEGVQDLWVPLVGESGPWVTASEESGIWTCHNLNEQEAGAPQSLQVGIQAGRCLISLHLWDPKQSPLNLTYRT